MRSSAFMTSTISRGLARSIEAVRGLRRSVTLGSIIPFGAWRRESRPNLPAASSEPQELGAHVNKYILLALILVAGSADAQVRRRAPVVSEPSMWGSLSVGLYGANGVSDGATNSTWDFGEGTSWQFRAALEKALQNQFSLGGVLTYVDVPFVYIGPSCGRCDAHLDLTSLGVSFHAGGGPGLH